MNFINFKVYIQLIIFSLIFIASRFDSIIFFNTLDIDLDPNYKIAIKENFWEYIYFSHVGMLGKILFDKFIFFISNLSGIKILTSFYIFNILSTYFFFSFIIIYINKIFKKNNTIKLVLFLFIVSVSYYFSNYEIWKPNYHDHLIFSLIALFSISVIFKDSFRFNKSIYFIFILILVSYTLGVTFFATSALFILIYNFAYKKSCKNDLLMFFFLLAAYALLSLKNYQNVNVFSPSSNGGANLIQRTIHSIGNENYNKLINNHKKIPKWIKVCNNEIYEKYSNIKEIDNDFFNSKLAHGHCFKKKNGHLNLLKYKEIILEKNIVKASIAAAK